MADPIQNHSILQGSNHYWRKRYYRKYLNYPVNPQVFSMFQQVHLDLRYKISGVLLYYTPLGPPKKILLQANPPYLVQKLLINWWTAVVTGRHFDFGHLV